MESTDANKRDTKLQKIVRDSLLSGQFYMALWAAQNAIDSDSQSSMLESVASCMAYEEEYDWARYVAGLMKNDDMKQQTLDKIFDLEHKSLRYTPPPSCRTSPWFRMPSGN